MQIRVVLTGPPRVVLGRAAVELELPGPSGTVDQVLRSLAEAEPRIARYLRGDDGQAPASLRLLVNDRLPAPGTRIPEGATITLLYAVAGGSGRIALQAEALPDAATAPGSSTTRTPKKRTRICAWTVGMLMPASYFVFVAFGTVSCAAFRASSAGICFP